VLDEHGTGVGGRLAEMHDDELAIWHDDRELSLITGSSRGRSSLPVAPADRC
jgi:hypothetical protein